MLPFTLPLGYATIIAYMIAGAAIMHASNACPSNVHWSDNGLERDLYIQMKTVTVLAMDGRRRWLDIQKLVSL